MPVRPLRGEASCRPSASLPGVSPPPLSPPGFPAGMKESSDSAVTEKSRESGGASPSLKGEERPELRPVLQLLCPARPTAAGAPVPRGRAPLCPDPPLTAKPRRRCRKPFWLRAKKTNKPTTTTKKRSREAADLPHFSERSVSCAAHPAMGAQNWGARPRRGVVPRASRVPTRIDPTQGER